MVYLICIPTSYFWAVPIYIRVLFYWHWLASFLLFNNFTICVLDILFSSNHNIHKSSCGLCFWASDPLIHRFTKIFQLKDLRPKNKGHTSFYECCNLTKKVYLSSTQRKRTQELGTNSASETYTFTVLAALYGTQNVFYSCITDFHETKS